MKNLYKRVLSMLMAMLMLIPCTTVAWASETEEPTSLEETIISQEDSSVSPRILEKIMEGQTTEGKFKYEVNTNFSEPMYLIIVLFNSVELTVTVEGTSGDAKDLGYMRKFYSTPDVTIFTISYLGGKFPKGDYTIEVSVSADNSPYAFNLFKSDTAY